LFEKVLEAWKHHGSSDLGEAVNDDIESEKFGKNGRKLKVNFWRRQEEDAEKIMDVGMKGWWEREEK